jgi:hypothetical protein
MVFSPWCVLQVNEIAMVGYAQFVNDCFKAWSTHLTKMILSGSMWLFLDIATSLNFLNAILKGSSRFNFEQGQQASFAPNALCLFCHIGFGLLNLPGHDDRSWTILCKYCNWHILD